MSSSRALARDKNQRFQSVQEMVDAFLTATGGRDALPSMAMSLGSGPVAGQQGTAVWQPNQHAPGPGPNVASITGSGPQTGSVAAMTGPHAGPLTGSTAGLASTGATPKSKGPGAAIAIVAVLLFVGALGAGAFFLFFRSTPATGAAGDPATTTSAAPSVTVQPSATVTVAASEAPAGTVAPEPAVTVAPSATATATAKVVAKPKSTGTAATSPAPAKTKEKWF